MENPKKKCLGNFCQLENPDCNSCKIDEALEGLETDALYLKRIKN